MNPDYLWLTDAIQMLTFLIVAPLVSIAVAYVAWRGKPQSFNTERYVIVCFASGLLAALLLALSKWMNADVRTAEYFLQLVCVLLSFLLLGVGAGCVFPVFLRVWRWHKASRLTDRSLTER